ncbi:hypothetical protein QVA66_02920 [Staphylococcus chromogenes]|nr:hypothetical protein [Staphylococcus chromogenes]
MRQAFAFGCLMATCLGDVLCPQASVDSLQDNVAKRQVWIDGESFDASEREEILANYVKHREVNPEVSDRGPVSWVRKAVVYVLKHERHRLPKKV